MHGAGVARHIAPSSLGYFDLVPTVSSPQRGWKQLTEHLFFWLGVGVSLTGPPATIGQRPNTCLLWSSMLGPLHWLGNYPPEFARVSYTAGPFFSTNAFLQLWAPKDKSDDNLVVTSAPHLNRVFSLKIYKYCNSGSQHTSAYIVLILTCFCNHPNTVRSRHVGKCRIATLARSSHLKLFKRIVSFYILHLVVATLVFYYKFT